MPGVFVANADGPLVLASSGTISSELASLENQSWLIVSYSLAMCAVQSAVRTYYLAPLLSLRRLSEWELLIVF